MQHSKKDILTTERTKDTKLSDSVFLLRALRVLRGDSYRLLFAASKGVSQYAYNYNLFFASL
jgi:hypothetical protein